MFWLLCHNDSSAGIKMSVLLVSGSINNVQFHSSPHISQQQPQIVHFLHFVCETLLNYATDFIVNWSVVRAVQ